jgi:hypothetical protein
VTPRRIHQISVVLLLLGFGAALGLYLTAQPPELDPFGNPLTSKKYLHELRVMGGNANVAFAEFEAWLQSLWQGKNRAVSVAVITVFLTVGFRFVARHPELFRPDHPVTSERPRPADKASSGPTRGGPERR